jgi:uncharacterized glyoxalase superfamily protein PhnB
MTNQYSLHNRSMPSSAIIPVLLYTDVRQAVEWLCATFGFVERLRIGDHRSQLEFNTGAIVVTGGHGYEPGDANADVPASHSLMVRVVDVDRHYDHVVQSGAKVFGPPTDFQYGERQYTAEDPGRHRWTFSQTVWDVDPREWGGELL